jgi:hypothetical protein
MAKEINIDINVKAKDAEKNLQTVGVGLKGIQEGAKAAGKSMFSLNAIFKGVGAAKAFDAILNVLKETFMSNQQVVDTLSTATTGLKIAFNDLFDFLAGGLTNITSFGQAIVDSIKDPILDSIKAIKFFGEAALRVLSLDFAGAAAAAGQAQVFFNEAVEGGKLVLEDLTDAVSNYVKETVNEAKSITDLNNARQLSIAQNNIIKEQKDREAEQLRQVRDEERNTIDERIVANNELGEVLEEQARLMLANNDIAIAAAQAQVNINDTIENQVALLEAQGEREAILAQIEGFRSEQKANDLALDKERLELQQSTAQGEIEVQNILAQGQAELIDNEVLRLEKQKEIALQEQELTRQVLEDKKASYKEGTQAFIDAQNELNSFNAESAVTQQKLDKEIADAKVSAVTGALGSLASLVGENSKFGKAIAITQAIIDTYAGANKALGQGGIFGFIGAASVIAAGFANIRNITSTKEPAPPSFAKGGTGGSVPTPAISTPPAFNVVGATAESQLAQTIAGAQQKPVRAYVVSSDVSTQQALDRKTANQATLGN